MSGDLGNHLFSFAVISDSHVNEEEDRSASPFASNKLANRRLRYVVESLNRQQLAFVVHLGDMGNPLPELASYMPAADRFMEIVSGLQAPLHLVAGNHCIGDKPGGWVPVPRVSIEALTQYQQVYGRQYYSFDHGPCHFVILSSLLIGSGLEIERQQSAWIEQELSTANRAGKRVWLMMHYPPYIAAPDERGSYDNLDEPGRSWLLGLLENFDIDAAFSGHVHNYFYNRYAGTDLITIPATSFVRQDYSEVFRVAPEDPEGGRADLAKLGYCRVDVFERGHTHHIERTLGQIRAPGTPERPAAGYGLRVRTGNTLAGIEMRENWMSRFALSANNSVSPFTRRLARNDWAVLALSEMGISRIRLFVQELADEDVIERMSTLQEAGFEFLVYSHGIPGEKAYRLVREHRALMAGWELILTPDQVAATARRLAKIVPSAGGESLPCYLNEVRDLSRAEVDDANVKHEAVYGFQVHERANIDEMIQRSDVNQAFRGLVFRLRRTGQRELSPWEAIRAIDEMGREQGMHHQAHILFSGNLTAERMVDDLSTANRVAESLLAAALAESVDLTFDTLEDIDRGYFVHHGLVDRRYNPRLAANVVRHLGSALAHYGTGGARATSLVEKSYGRAMTAETPEGFMTLIAPKGPFTLREIDIVGSSDCQVLRLLNLENGALVETHVTRHGTRFRLTAPAEVNRPMLVTSLDPVR